MLIVPDTNLIISAWVYDGRPFKFFEAALDAGYEFVICPAIIDEIHEVLQRPKFLRVKKKPDFTPPPLSDFLAIVHVVEPIPVSLTVGDKKDVMLFGCAAAAGADYIISGDKTVHEVVSYGNIKVRKIAEIMDESSLKPLPWTSQPPDDPSPSPQNPTTP